MGFKIIDPNYKAFIITRKKNLLIAIFADTHIGGVTAYLSSGCFDERGNVHLQNKDQIKMEVNLLTSLIKMGKVDVVIFLGDMVEGKNSKAGGLDVGNVNTDCQVEWALRFAISVCDILKPKYILGLNGSDYHVENSLDRRLLHRISLHYPNTDVYYGNPTLKFILGDKLWFLSHQAIEGASKAGTLERYWNKICTKTFGRERTPEVIGYSHIHQAQNPYQIKNGKHPVYGFIAPCMKLPDMFCGKGPTGTYWEIGYMKLEQEGKLLRGEYVNTYPYWEEKQ